MIEPAKPEEPDRFAVVIGRVFRVFVLIALVFVIGFLFPGTNISNRPIGSLTFSEISGLVLTLVSQ